MGINETLLEVQYPFGPGTTLPPNSTLSSFRTYTILFDSDDLERQSLQRRKMVRTLAPQVTENMLSECHSDPGLDRLALVPIRL